MRILTVTLIMMFSAVNAIAEPWSVTGDGRYGCNTLKDVAQLRLLSSIKSAFDVVLIEKIEEGACVELKPGEALVKLSDASENNLAVFKVKRADGRELYVEAGFLERTI